MLYQISKASKYYGADTVFEDINFEIKGNERDCQGYKRSFKDFYWLIFLESKTFYTLTI